MIILSFQGGEVIVMCAKLFEGLVDGNTVYVGCRVVAWLNVPRSAR
jgi:hypothetical protein